VTRTKATGVDDIKDPRWVFAGLIGATIILALVFVWVVDQSVTDRNDRLELMKQIASGASLSISLFLGSIVAIQAYRYVNRLSHNWKIRHDYAIDRLGRLYGPLWDETKCIIKALEDHYRSGYYDQGRGFSPGVSSVQKDSLHVQRYEQLANSHLQLFLAKRVMDALQSFHGPVADYDALRDEVKSSMALRFRASLKDNELLANSAEVKRENAVSALWSEISHDGNLSNFLNPQPDPRLESRMKARFKEYLRANLSVSDEDGDVIYARVTDDLRRAPRLTELHSLRDECLKKGESLLAVLKGIIERPESALE